MNRPSPPKLSANPSSNSVDPEQASTPAQSRLEKISLRFDVVEKQIVIAGTSFTILKVLDTNTLVDSIDPKTFSVDERLPYWADIWTSAIELARYCLMDAELTGKYVLELGCGLGLAGIAAARAGANVVFSDYERDAHEFAIYNASRNLSPEIVNSRTRFIDLDWRKVNEQFLPQQRKFDMIIAADVVYERRNFFPLIDVLQRLLSPSGVAIFTEPGRTIGEQFFKLLNESGFDL